MNIGGYKNDDKGLMLIFYVANKRLTVCHVCDLSGAVSVVLHIMLLLLVLLAQQVADSLVVDLQRKVGRGCWSFDDTKKRGLRTIKSGGIPQQTAT